MRKPRRSRLPEGARPYHTKSALKRDGELGETLARYDYLVWKATKYLQVGSADMHDALQAGRLALLEATRRYRPGPAPFQNFAWARLLHAIREAVPVSLESYESLEELQDEELLSTDD